ncbi:MAG: fimbrial protein [Fermentimonas sp.]|nr:fimbrial protein [Fermentimonas sp.]
MKIFKVLLVVAIAFGMMACNNEDVPQVNGDKDASISIRVFPSSDGPSFRATGNLDGNGIIPAGLAAESAIKTLEVWVFVGNALEAYKSATIADGAVPEVIDIEVTSGPRTIVVVANASLGTQATLTGLKALTKNLTQDVSAGLVMTAEPIENVTLVKGNNYYGYSGTTSEGENYLNQGALALTRVNARVAIVAADIQLATLPDGEVHVAMFNVPKTTNLFGAPLAINGNYLFGYTWPSPLGTYTVGTAESSLLDGTITFPITNALAPYYYVNENTAENANEQMFIVLRGKPYMGDDTHVNQYQGLYTDAEGYTYYPVWVNATKDGYSYTGANTGDSEIRRNTQYNISLTITGIGRPTIDEPETAWLDVKVEVAPWAVVTQNVTW